MCMRKDTKMSKNALHDLSRRKNDSSILLIFDLIQQGHDYSRFISSDLSHTGE